MKLELNNLDNIMRLVDCAPKYNVHSLRDNTIRDPKWISFGTGNIFRAYIARLNQDLINLGLEDRGIITVASRRRDSIEKVYSPSDNLSLSLTLKNDGNFETTLLANIAEALYIKSDMKRLEEIFINPSLQIVSFIITEKGYNIFNSDGTLVSGVEKELKNNPKDANHLMILIVHLLYKRYLKGYPITLLSLDNLSKNGEVLKKTILFIANYYIESGFYKKEFYNYLSNEKIVSYPYSMIDKITPGADETVARYLEKKGFEDIRPISTNNASKLSKYVNSEELEYLAIEDNFTNGRPKFEKAGVYMVDRETVTKIETMKVTACLNPLHTSLAIFGCLLGHRRINEEMKDKNLQTFVKKLVFNETLPVVENPGVIDPKEFAKEVIEVRLPNKYLPDSPQRIATDTSQKIPIRFGKTLASYKSRKIKTDELVFIPLTLAAWLRYLLGVDDFGKDMKLSPDPLLEELQSSLNGIKLGSFRRTESLKNLLRNSVIFGVDLKEVGIYEKVLHYFEELSEGRGSVRKTLEKYTS